MDEYHRFTMDPAQSVLEVLASARADQAPPELLAMVGRSGLEANFMAHLASDVARLDDQDMAERFAFHCPVPGVHADEYKTRLLELPGNGRSLVGIRFRGLDLARPFVAVVASEALPGDQDELVAAVAELGREFERFAPTHVRVFLPSHTGLRPDRPGQFWEKRLLVGRVRDLKAGPKPVGADRLALSKPSDDGWYARYENAFGRLVARAPEYDEYTRLESHEDLAELIDAGTLFEALIDGELAGLVAVARDGVEGVDGYLVIEILLADHARGRGFGAGLQWRLAERLGDADQLLLGTIDARNLPAIGAATSVGRVDVGGYLWVPVAR